MFEVLTIACGVVLLYTYAAYPLLLWVVSRFFRERRPGLRSGEDGPGEMEPVVSILVAAYNEERCIVRRLKNLGELDYPMERLQILVGSDGSTDETVALARAVSMPCPVEILDHPQRRGKASVLNDLARTARGEILAFTDANTRWKPGALRRLVHHFSYPTTGGVTGRLVLVPRDDEERIERDYWGWENEVKRLESRLGTTLGATGAIYAIRACLWRALPTDRPLMDDFVTGCRVVMAGKRLVFEPEAVARESTSSSLPLELVRKRRIFVANFRGLPLLWGLPWRPLPAWIFVSRKLLRWTTPLWLAGLALGSLGCPRTWPGLAALGIQAVLYGAALAYAAVGRSGKRAAFLLPAYYFVRLQWELLAGFVEALFSRPSAIWERSDREGESGLGHRTGQEPGENGASPSSTARGGRLARPGGDPPHRVADTVTDAGNPPRNLAAHSKSRPTIVLPEARSQGASGGLRGPLRQ